MEYLIKFNPVAFSLVIPVLITGFLAAYAFTRRSVAGSQVVAFLLLALCVWSFFYGVELSCLTLGAMMACAVLEYLGIATSPVLLLLLMLEYTGKRKWVTMLNVLVLMAIPAVTIIMVATNDLHHLHYSSVSLDSSGPFPMMTLGRGPWYWVHTTYSYAMLMISTVLLIVNIGKPGSLFYSQSIAMLIGLSLPFVVNIVYAIFAWMPFGHLDMTPFAFAVTGVIIAWSIFRHGLFEIMPTAHDIIVDGLDDVMVVLDGQNRILECNRAAQTVLGMAQSDIGGSVLVKWKDWPGLLDLIKFNRPDRIELSLFIKNEPRYYEAFAYTIRGLLQRDQGKVVTLHDITGMKQAERALRQSEEKYRHLIEHSHDIIYTLTLGGIFTFVSPAWTRLLGHQVDYVIGKSYQLFVHPDDIARCNQFLDDVVRTNDMQDGVEYRVRHIDGSWYWHTSSAVPIRNEGGKIIGMEGIARDITERKQMQHKLEEMATHDYLTGLPNRILLIDRFSIAASLANRNKSRLVIMSLDLDEFKPINDMYGHDLGDRVLKIVSARLLGIIRGSDTLARVGGDEFVLLMMENNNVQDSAVIAQKILDSFTSPLVVDGHDLHLSTSIGIAVYPEDGTDLETLVKKSDAAMYYSKGHGRNQYIFYSDCNTKE